MWKSPAKRGFSVSVQLPCRDPEVCAEFLRCGAARGGGDPRRRAGDGGGAAVADRRACGGEPAAGGSGAELERRLKRSSRNSSLPPSQDPPSAAPRPRQPGSGRKRGGQPGHEGRHRRLLAPEQVDEVVEHWPERCRSCAHVFAEAGAGRGRGAMAAPDRGAPIDCGQRDQASAAPRPQPPVRRPDERQASRRCATVIVRPEVAGCGRDRRCGAP